MLFPLPRPLSDLLRDTTSSLTPLDKAGAVANALLLASHPWLLRSSHSPPRWTLDSLRGELAPLFQPNTHCAGDLHWAQNGTVYYSDDGRARRRRTREPCARLLRLLATAEGAAHGVVNLEGNETCAATLGPLGAAMGDLRAVADAVTAAQLVPALTNLRVGLHASAYGLHFDRHDNVILQLQGTKRLLLAPPSQAAHAYLHPDGHPEARHSPVDWRAPDLTTHPRAAKLRGLWAVLSPGDVLLVPAGWLHHVAANEPPPPAIEDNGGLRARPWASLNLFFDVRMRPRFPLFDACDGGAADASLAQAPPVHRQALERLGVGPARAAYCAHI